MKTVMTRNVLPLKLPPYVLFSEQLYYITYLV